MTDRDRTVMEGEQRFTETVKFVLASIPCNRGNEVMFYCCCSFHYFFMDLSECEGIILS